MVKYIIAQVNSSPRGVSHADVRLAMEGIRLAMTMIRFAQNQGFNLDAIEKREILAAMSTGDLAKEVKDLSPSERNKILKNVIKDKRRLEQGHVHRGAVRAGKVGAGAAAAYGLGTLAASGAGAASLGVLAPLGLGAAAAGGAIYGTHQAYKGGLHGYRLMKKRGSRGSSAEVAELERALLKSPNRRRRKTRRRKTKRRKTRRRKTRRRKRF